MSIVCNPYFRRWRQCVKAIIGSDDSDVSKEMDDKIVTFFQKAVEAMYARAYFTASAKQKIKKSTDAIIMSLKETFKGSEWMSEETKKYAMKKVYNMNAYILYSDEVLDNDKINVLYQNYTSVNFASQFTRNRNNIIVAARAFLATLTEDQTDWRVLRMGPMDNAYYAGGYFVIMMGYAEGNTFSEKVPDLFNYALLGNIIGHEITHGFDNNNDGRWSIETKTKYGDKIKCIVELYTNLRNKYNSATQREDTADIGGLKMAYR
jgi:putative endopeptidase